MPKRKSPPVKHKSSDNKHSWLAPKPPKCVICGKYTSNKQDSGKSFQPKQCQKKTWRYAHKICGKCWWGDFALEGRSHACPGCVKGLPLPKPPKQILRRDTLTRRMKRKKAEPGFILDLTNDDL